MDVVTLEQPPAKGSALHVIALAVAKASANSTLATFRACEASLRAASNLLRFCVLKPTAFAYLPLLTSLHGACSAGAVVLIHLERLHGYFGLLLHPLLRCTNWPGAHFS